ncbi:hypothetical protein BDV36DRAFT_281318 [Aspergillus pseudocaelatus]|uniref:Altered inheritance of mitochondria protein 9, mitochondrial n=1 Tax=Aspergillus pseudocaelatus TaxID=1825620 RepID=A0ABQ6WU60_9EURO|nr:hypothetical protein BDV36DRAFT_281318 [Aspergillus pseudocaelatus]
MRCCRRRATGLINDLWYSIFQFTSGRWLWAEKKQLAARYVAFTVEALCSVAAQSVWATSSIDVTKLTEGDFNKALLLTMNDGKEVIAKVLNLNAGHPYFTTASEIAGIQFVRNVLHIPAPKVFAWCSNASESPKSQIVTQLATFGKALASKPFPGYGSLYFAEDGACGDNFVVSPTTNRKYLDDERGTLTLYHGPSTVEEYFIVNAQRENESILYLGASPQLQGLFNGPGQYQSSKAARLRALGCYTQVAKYLLPQNKATHRPVLWHSDLHTDNIFVDPEEPTRITVKKLHADQSLYVFYEIELLKQCRDADNALRLRDTLVSQIAALSGSLFTDGEPIVLGCLMQVVDRWAEIVGQDTEGRPLVLCPNSFTEEKRSRQREDQAKWEGGVILMDGILDQLGTYHYGARKQLVLDVQGRLFMQVATTDDERSLWSKAWPFSVSDK